LHRREHTRTVELLHWISSVEPIAEQILPVKSPWERWFPVGCTTSGHMHQIGALTLLEQPLRLLPAGHPSARRPPRTSPTPDEVLHLLRDLPPTARWA